MSYLLFFSFLFDRFYQTRYGIFVNYWYIVVVAVGIFVIYSALHQLLNNRLKYVVNLIVLLLFFNWNQVLLPALRNANGVHPITDEFHYEMEAAAQYLLEHSKEGDVLVATNIDEFLFLYYETDLLEFEKVFRYFILDSEKEKVINQAVLNYDQGWIVLDYQQGFLWEQPLPFEDFELGAKTVIYHGRFGDQFIYHWGE
ncbi:MAG: hypothetical protein FVQ83_06210 [Chloroflexi bacterium]|nr:hypothetical protein [Chloroflexota bacterium]